MISRHRKYIRTDVFADCSVCKHEVQRRTKHFEQKLSYCWHGRAILQSYTSRSFAVEWGYLSITHSFSVIVRVSPYIIHCRKLDSMTYILLQTPLWVYNQPLWCNWSHRLFVEFGKIAQDSRSFRVINFSTSWKPVCEYINNSTLLPILHRFRDTADYWYNFRRRQEVSLVNTLVWSESLNSGLRNIPLSYDIKFISIY